MTKRENVRQEELLQLEAEFYSLLVPCLEKCARGRYGLFGQNDHLDPDGKFWAWPEAARLKNVAREILLLKAQFGEISRDCSQFLQLCELRGSNVPGEPKLAAEFLAMLKP